ncbi:MAG: NAD-dependent malic enzyme 1 [Deltaproteobacteria bacterium RBG_13_65_10]|jgi:malate dehydrogenase (oxaloacetate-decarboxylating)|nr:MAG: NAD-dependent malic enzyme 1 [Deltaproteobacteria bacterium RBG_13_65_10]
MAFTTFQNKIMRTLRVKNENSPGVLGRLATTIGDAGGIFGDIKTISVGRSYAVRDMDVEVDDEAHLERILSAIRKLKQVDILEVRDEVLEFHERGKIDMVSTRPVRTLANLRKIYTPGVATVCRGIFENPEFAWLYTAIPKLVAIVTNGSRVLGLGNIGPVASMPVMEGKAALLSQFVGLSGVPILINSNNADEIVETVIQISSTFGGIHLEDIATPLCYEVETRLIAALEKPVMHDDQHGTAVVALAAIINAAKIAELELNGMQIGQIGLGAAGLAIAKMVMGYTGKPVLGADLNPEAMARFEAVGGIPSTLEEIMRNAHLVVATSGVANLIKPAMVRKGQVILALTNPDPEIKPKRALARGARFAADGRSVNNLLGYPGIWKGSLDARACRINSEMYVAAAQAVAAQAEEGELVPGPISRRVHREVARAVARAAMDSGVARVKLDEDYFNP